MRYCWLCREWFPNHHPRCDIEDVDYAIGPGSEPVPQCNYCDGFREDCAYCENGDGGDNKPPQWTLVLAGSSPVTKEGAETFVRHMHELVQQRFERLTKEQDQRRCTAPFSDQCGVVGRGPAGQAHGVAPRSTCRTALHAVY